MTPDPRRELLAALRVTDAGDTVPHLECALHALGRAWKATEAGDASIAVENVQIAKQALDHVVASLPEAA